MRSVAKPREAPILEANHPFNARSQGGSEMVVYPDLFTAAAEEQELDSPFTGLKTTSLTGPAIGLDDFKLIAFLVVEPTSVTV
jgi:hypothetical protein